MKEKMKKLPIGLQTFSELIRENYVYVDKTKLIYTMISSGKYYFCARPRRFGKSLLVSTLSDIFSARKELFEGLAINDQQYDWQEYPIIKIALSDIPCRSVALFENGIKLYLRKIAQQHNISLSDDLTPGQTLQDLVESLATKNRVVLLIDEYDYPILQNLHETKLAEEMRNVLRDFYIVTKGLDSCFRFVFFTGVSKFSKTSLFSGLNNLNDISLDVRYNELFGYTEDEIKRYFGEHIQKTSQIMNISPDALFTEITAWYDGYLFSIDNTKPRLYNPFSMMLCLDKNAFSNYWFQTGTPTFLINLLRLKDYPIQDYEQVDATEQELSNFDVDKIPLKTLLFQTGYLTIKRYDVETRNYTLCFPNRETSDSLMSYIFADMIDSDSVHLNTTTSRLLKAFNSKMLSTKIFNNLPL